MNNNMKLFMCKPKYFDIIHKNLNIHMTMEQCLNKQKANMQYWNLTRLLSNIGFNIKFIEAQKTLVDMVFAANGALIDSTTNTAIISNFRVEPRKAEKEYWRIFLRDNGKNKKNTNSYFEGQGDALFSHKNKNLWIGHGFRSSLSAGKEIQEILPHSKVHSLKLIDSRFYHLDTCFCVLKESTVMYYPAAFDNESVAKINEYFDNIIEVDKSNALNFACNAVQFQNYVIMHSASKSLKEDLRNLGFSVIENNMSEFLLSGGSAKCCVMQT